MTLTNDALLPLIAGVVFGAAVLLPLLWRQRRRMRAVIAQSRRLEARAHTDALTGLASRAAFKEALRVALSRARRAGTPVAVLMVELEGLRAINQSFGSAAGDQLLRLVAERLGLGLRVEDQAARMSGACFAVLQDGGDQPEAAARMARRLASLLAAPYTLKGQPVPCGTVIGVVIGDPMETTADSMMRSAEEALARARAEGKGIAFLDPAMDVALQGRRQLEMELREAVALKAMTLHWQPVYALPGRQLLACEALLRWQHPTRGLLPAGDFMAIAEETGLIVPLCRWTLRAACREAAGWPVPLSVAVNISPAQFRHDDVVDAVQNALAASGLAPGRLELEVTEGLVARNTEMVLGQINGLRALGVKVVLDDFGAGAASLTHLVRFPLDRLKLDRGFTAELGTDARALAVTEAVCALSRRLGIEACASGVETEAELAQLAGLGFGRAQGFLLGRPQPSAALREMMQASAPWLPEATRIAAE
ncbi:putative bifunctional diguanylate cyclase/phosphodiesterase [Plastoroseomonas arctica]|uniref:GGDEF and EAL domain-containing protein n=1 Tax=Plastoroseomonas arctica TaxID=1509237 RepID=A0AAF1KL35_9PROT|nr:GGDEF and EAL domain-containing protein [Plastoroseomonas arctica]MBR0654266.1 GGDEF and EAL domain-containing protein [Plastoroseomonas arctica]